MTLLDQLHQRVDALTPQQQKTLKEWLDYHAARRRTRNGAATSGTGNDLEDLTIGRTGIKLAAQTWPREDFSGWSGYRKPRSGKKRK